MNDRNAPATKGDIEDVRAEIEHVRDDLRADMKSMEDRLVETFRDTQTELLKALYGFAQSTDAKLKQTEIDDMMLRQRLTAVESRLTEVEKRLNMPPGM